MSWVEAHGLTLTLLAGLAVHWVRMEISIAVLKRDMEWMRASLVKWGMIPPAARG
jgi:hypothetical protein